MEPLYFKVPRLKDQTLRVEKWDLNFFFYPIHFHEECQLTYVIEGEGTFFVGESLSEFTSGEAFLFGKNIPHVLRNNPEYYRKNPNIHARAMSLFFCADTFSNIFKQLPEAHMVQRLLNYSSHGIRLKGRNATIVYKSLKKMYKNTGFDKITEFLNLLNTISKNKNLNLISTTSIPIHSVTEESKRINAVFEYVMANFKSRILLKNVASLANMSPTAFCRFFKARTRKTFSQFLIEVRIGNACKMLTEGDFNITECCFASGYNNIANFHRHFKKITKLNPSDYRKKIKTIP